MKLSNALYDALKSLAQVWLPALGTLYFAIASVWGLEHPEQVIGTITAIDTFLGVGLGLSSRSYSAPADGHLVIDKRDPAKDIYQLNLGIPVSEVDKRDSISLKVVNAGGAS